MNLRMYIQKYTIVLLMFLMSISAFSQQTKKSISAIRVSEAPQIDGVINETSWENAPIGGDFTQFSPYNGSPSQYKNEVRVVYTDRALYVSAVMYQKAENLRNDLTVRDQSLSQANTDSFVLSLIPFIEGLDGFQFRVSAAGIQVDEKISDGQYGLVKNTSWDAVWNSEVKVNEDCWVVEIEIPFSELRFSGSNLQDWGINMWRMVKHVKEYSTFNHISTSQQGIIRQAGILKGIQGVKPPLRLSMVPYFSSTLLKLRNSDKVNTKVGGGMDVKYGINESFTLDMILIPDFSEVESDDQILNLSPFETKFEEKRPFFTEGVELFNRGNIFYSKRIGGKPSGYNEVERANHREVINNPSEAKLINATKISGRTNKGLGLGFFNAMTSNTYANVIDESGREQEVRTEGFSNYNMIVIDQTLKNNSYLSFMNTNVIKTQSDFMANVSGTDFRFENKARTYSLKGNAIVSQRYFEEDDNEIGHHYFLEFSKISGKFQFEVNHTVMSDTYNPNDMGYNRQNNRFEFEQELKYNITQPFGSILQWYNTLEFEQGFLFKPRESLGYSIAYESDIRFNNYWDLAFFIKHTPNGWNDFFYTGVDGVKFRWTPWLGTSVDLSTDNSKRFSIALGLAYGKNFGAYKDFKQYHYRITLEPQFRVNNRLQLNYAFSYEMDGYFKVVNREDPEHIYLGQAMMPTYINTLTANYVFNDKMALKFRLRHYWSRAEYDQFFELQESGLAAESDYTGSHDVNYNAFNINLIYSWRFAPGSELSLIWKYAIDEREDHIRSRSFAKNFTDLFDLPSQNSLSLKILYYIDWQNLKRKN